MIWQYANGIENSIVRSAHIGIKGIGNSTTTPFDVEDIQTANMYLLSLTETVATRLREAGFCCSLVSVGLKNNNFRYYSHQCKLNSPTDSTDEIYCITKQLFKEMWKGEPLRHLGVRVSDLTPCNFVQLSLFSHKDPVKMRALDKAVDYIRSKYGPRAITRAIFTHSRIPALNGGVGEEEYPMMSSMMSSIL
ncbi:hypothetical protein [Thermanaerosceptrum fracticalcis]|uniref:DinB/UmuC family translesion DNA polymerase n=1 Tax=Thermanaerosceptrum fracticalcis TaxID=1712410 RepID=UPI001378AA3B|nr:hypothetical protein [Thermanaerosceptrum fracticalcis]